MPTQEQDTYESLPCDICGANAGIDPWHHSKGASNHIHACEDCHSEIVAEQAETERNARRYLALRENEIAILQAVDNGFDADAYRAEHDAAADRLLEGGK